MVHLRVTQQIPRHARHMSTAHLKRDPDCRKDPDKVRFAKTAPAPQYSDCRSEHRVIKPEIQAVQQQDQCRNPAAHAAIVGHGVIYPVTVAQVPEGTAQVRPACEPPKQPRIVRRILEQQPEPRQQRYPGQRRAPLRQRAGHREYDRLQHAGKHHRRQGCKQKSPGRERHRVKSTTSPPE